MNRLYIHFWWRSGVEVVTVWFAVTQIKIIKLEIIASASSPLST